MATPTLALSRLRIRVIGSQTAEPESPHPYTVYRTAVTYEGECYERLLRYSQFYSFFKKLKFKKPRAIKAPFPGRTWTRKAAFDDDLIEARQVLLNEFMKEVCSHDLSAQSQTHLMKLLRIGPYEDGSGRVSELLSSFHASYIKSDRGGSSKMDAILETLREEDKDIKDETIAVAHTATLTSTTFEFPAITSNATTVLADDERSILGSRQRLTSAEAAEMMNDHHAISTNARTNGLASNRPENRPRLQKATSSINATNGNHRPALKSSQSMPTSRRGSSRRVEFPADVTSGHDVENDAEDQENIDPEDKYKHLIHNQLGSIRRLLSESETIDTDMSSTRSNHLALTA